MSKNMRAPLAKTLIGGIILSIITYLFIFYYYGNVIGHIPILIVSLLILLVTLQIVEALREDLILQGKIKIGTNVCGRRKR